MSENQDNNQQQQNPDPNASPSSSSSSPPQEIAEATNENNNNNQNNTGGQPTGQIDTMQGTASDNVSKDIKGNVNMSRGIIGLKSAPTQSYITEGTIADSVNGPSKFPNAEGQLNPLSEQDLQDRIKMERSKAGLDKDYQEQLMVKIRTEAQGFDYKPEGQWADAEKYPELTATESRIQQKEPVVNSKQGEQLLTTEEIQSTDMQNTTSVPNNEQQNQEQQQQQQGQQQQGQPQPEQSSQDVQQQGQQSQ